MQQTRHCPNIESNLKDCGCTYPSCEKKGQCCECIRFHRERGELPGCLFPAEAERTYDRSVENLVSSRR